MMSNGGKIKVLIQARTMFLATMLKEEFNHSKGFINKENKLTYFIFYFYIFYEIIFSIL